MYLLERDAQDIPNDEWETLISARASWLYTAKEFGIPPGLLGRLMSSRELTEYQALNLIDAARSLKDDDG